MRPRGWTRPWRRWPRPTDAFVDGDVSRLKLGAVLKVPTSRKIKSLSASQVASILGGRPAAPAAEAKAGADVLKLVPSEAGGGNISDLEQQVAAREQARRARKRASPPWKIN